MGWKRKISSVTIADWERGMYIQLSVPIVLSSFLKEYSSYSENLCTFNDSSSDTISSQRPHPRQWKAMQGYSVPCPLCSLLQLLCGTSKVSPSDVKNITSTKLITTFNLTSFSPLCECVSSYIISSLAAKLLLWGMKSTARPPSGWSKRGKMHD